MRSEALLSQHIKIDDAAQIAKEAGLRYVNDSKPGYTRVRNGDHYDYYDQHNNKIEDQNTILRINRLIVPHIWEKVWICPYERGHLQATGFDKKGRKQYRYHKYWDKARNEKKFDKMLQFGLVLPEIRKEVQSNLSLHKLTRDKVLSTVVALLDETLIRIGNKEYAKTNKTYGLTTLRNKHVKNLGGKVQLEFIGKKSIEKKVIVSDRRLANIIKKCRELPGYDLFQYYNEHGALTPVGSEDINSYLKQLSGEEITAKDFRTWGGSTIAIKALMECEPCDDEKTIKKNIIEMTKKVSGCLGNTPTVCKGYYIHPIIIEKYTTKEIVTFVETHREVTSKGSEWLDGEEKLFLELLRQTHH